MSEDGLYPRCPACSVYLITGTVTSTLLDELKRQHNWTIGFFDKNAPPEMWNAVVIGHSTLWKCPKCKTRYGLQSRAERLKELRRREEERRRSTERSRRRWEEIQAMMKGLERGEFVPCPLCGSRLIYHTLGSGYHPGVFCEAGHTILLIEQARVEGP